MNKFVLAIGTTAGLLLCNIAVAGDVAPPAADAAVFPVHPGVSLKTADGRRIGYIDRVDTDRAGQPQTAQLIFGERVIHVPVSTIKSVDKSHFTTTLSYKDVQSL